MTTGRRGRLPDVWYLAVAEVWGPLRGVAGEPCSELLRSRTRCLYRGLWLIQRRSASQASGCMPLLVKLTASAMRAGRLLGRSSRHLQQVVSTSRNTLKFDTIMTLNFWLICFVLICIFLFIYFIPGVFSFFFFSYMFGIKCRQNPLISNCKVV